MENSPINLKLGPTFYFIGVTTSQSSIMAIFPLWMQELGHPEIRIEGVDLKIHDSIENYRTITAQIKYDPLSLGALITTHKIDLYAAAKDLFDYLDPFARICGEISCISKKGTRLEGYAKDPISAGLSMDALVGKDYFGRTGGHVIFFGAGGAAVATLLHLIMKPEATDRPKKVILVDRSHTRLMHVRKIVNGLSTDIRVEYICNSNPHENDKLMSVLPDYSLVINATGMGKDIPGSPITDQGLFPRYGIAWEFNYRGELNFLHQALAQVSSRGIKVEDGWLYFLHGWTQVISQVLHFNLNNYLFNKLANIASQYKYN